MWLGISVLSVDWTEVVRMSKLDEHEYVNRLNQYPRNLVRLGYYVEQYIESPAWVKVRREVLHRLDTRRLVK